MTTDKNKINRFKYDAKISHYYGILITNIILTIVTLGIYSFWGKTRFRKYSTSKFILLGKRFEYTGTGGELFKGFLKALLILTIFYLLLGMITGIISVIFNIPSSLLKYIILIIIISIYIFLIFIVIYSTTRYRYSRTAWQGIHGHLGGSAKKYAILSINRIFLNIITLGYLIPYSDLKTIGYIIDNSYFGNAKVNLVKKPYSLVRINIITLLLAIPTLGFSRLWYMAAFTKCAFNNIHIASVKFDCKYSGPKLFNLALGNLLILIFTLGVGFPFIIWRNLNFFAKNMAIIGNIDISKITQSKQNGEAIGEGANDLDTVLEILP